MTTPTSNPGANIEVDLQATNSRTFDVSEDYILEAREGGIPDTLVQRPADDASSGTNDKLGVQISTSQDWPEFQARISGNSSGFTTAYIHDVSNGNLMDSVDVSSLSAGDIVTWNSTNLAAGGTYNVVLDADGNSWTGGRLASPTYPYASSDGNLEIIDGAVDPTGRTTAAFGFDELGNLP